MKLKDLQLVKFAVSHCSDAFNDPWVSAFNKDIEIIYDKISNQVDKAQKKVDGIVIVNPTSVVKFLFNCLYHCLEEFFENEIDKDKLSLSIYYLCTNYVYEDHDELASDKDLPPVLVSFDKFMVPSSILRNIIEPLVGRIDVYQVLYGSFVALDSATCVNSINDVSKLSNHKFNTLTHADIPFVACNRSVRNKASIASDLLWQTLKCGFDEDKASRMLLEVFGDPSVIEKIVVVLRTLDGDSDFIINFLRFLQTNCKLNIERSEQIDDQCHQIVESVCKDVSFNKVASDGKYTPQVFRQWTEWSMLMGLIEKQLGSVRGSQWPATEALKPFEDKHREIIRQKAKKKNKKQLNFEELLETSREMFTHKASQPGKVYEVMLKENRVWK